MPSHFDIPIRLVTIDDLRPIESVAHGSAQPGLRSLTDSELLEAARNPERGDWLTENTRTGILVDGNGRAHKLKRRASDPASTITAQMLVPVDSYRPDLSMFPDLE